MLSLDRVCDKIASMRKSSIYFLLGLIFFWCPHQSFATEKLYNIAPSLTPDTQREMKTAGFWIARHPAPDQLILNQDEITQFNRSIQDQLKLTKDITQFTSTNGKQLKAELEKTWKDIVAKNYYGGDGHEPKVSFYQEVKMKMNLQAIEEKIVPSFGMIVHYANQRFFPTDRILTSEANDIDFDELQNSTLDVATPVVILHQSTDGLWCYVQSSQSFGWVKKENIAIGTLEEIKNFISSPEFVIATAPKADIFLNDQRIQHYDYVRMGVKLPLLEKDNVKVQVQIPLRQDDGSLMIKTGYMNLEDVHEGYLPYTPRNIIKQAFLLLNAPYGWGGMYGEQDCSAFLQEIFGTVGILLPRDSKDQAQVGYPLASFDKTDKEEKRLAALKNAVGGITILPLKGHIMLFLGMLDDRPFAIHETWGYRERKSSADVVRVLNRVVVSDLYLGAGSKKGSLLDRMLAIKAITKEQ